MTVAEEDQGLGVGLWIYFFNNDRLADLYLSYSVIYDILI